MELKTYFAQDAAGNIISSAIVNVFLQGTNTLATGLTRADGTPLDNPFAADGAGRIQFRAPDGYYDVQVSAGSGIMQTLTIQCVDYSGAKADADRAEAAAERADVSAEQVADAVALRGDLAEPGGAGIVGGSIKPITWDGFAGGADSTGVADSAAALSAVFSAAASGIGIFIPKGTYKEGSTSRTVDSDSIWLNRDFRGGISVVSSARSSPLQITIGTPDEPVNSGIYGRSGINITAVARGGQHANCIRTTLDNRSTDGNGNPSIYAAGLSYSTALWTAALHGETKHGGGTTIAASIEAASYTDQGTFYGIVLNNTSGNAQLNHPTTGSPITTHPLATALYVAGSDSRGDAGMWLRGIRFNSGSLRSGGTVLLDESKSLYGYCSASSSSKNGADIFLAGTAPQGIIIQGTYSSGNGIRLGSGIGIAYEGTGAIKTKYDSSTLRWGLFSGASEMVTFNTTTPGMYFNGVRVVSGQQAAIPNATAETVVDTLNRLLTANRNHGLIAS